MTLLQLHGFRRRKNHGRPTASACEAVVGSDGLSRLLWDVGGQITTAPPPPKDVPVLVPAACECYLHGTDSAGMTKLRTLQEEAILDHVVGTKASVSVL